MIPFLKPIFPSPDRWLPHIHQIYDNGWFSNNGKFIQQFEKELQKYLVTEREVVVVSSATLGLILTMKALDIQGVVLVPSFTFAATIGAIEWAGLEYEYIDIDKYWCMDAQLVEERLKQGGVGAIMPVHMFGMPCDITAYERLAHDYGVRLIFDAAPAMGSKYQGRHIGNFGDAEIFSLHATKVLPVGEGGVITVRSLGIARKIRQLVNFGLNEDRKAAYNGLNVKMAEIPAAIGIEALKDLETHVHNRQKYVKRYKELLPDQCFQPVRKKCRSSNQILGFRTSKGEDMVQYLGFCDIQLRQYFSPVHTHPAYKKDIVLPKTELLSYEIVNLPLYSVMDDNTIATVSSCLKRALFE